MSNPAADEARAMSDADLAEAINEAYRELFNLNFQRGTRQLQNPNATRTARRQIARLRTVLRERQLAGDGGSFVPSAAMPQPGPAPRQEESESEPEAAVAAEPGEAETGGGADAAAGDQERG